jgi:adenylyl cyclase-associated protein
MLSSLSWVITVPPPKTPSSYVNDILGATEFWSNKIRKTFKGIEGKEIHIIFCDCLKATIQELASYTKEFHPLGLSWNPKGYETIEEASRSLDSSEIKSPSTGPVKKVEIPTSGARGGGMAALVTELSSKITTDGSSAATGLRNVKREQQTWRKEYNPKNSVPTLSSKPAVVVSSALSNIKVGGESKSPIFLFDTTAQKWRVEYQNGKSSTSSAGNSNSNLKIQVQDVKEQVYIYQCQNVTIEISGKCKTIVIDGCSKVQVVFGTAISSCEVVNSKRIQVQTLGVCPTFAIDKTDGCLIFLSKETMTVSSFVTSKSSEMNGKLFHAYHIRLF